MSTRRTPTPGDEVYVRWVDIEARLDASVSDMQPRIFRTRGTYLGEGVRAHRGARIPYTYVRGGDWDENAGEYRELNAIPTHNVLSIKVIKHRHVHKEPQSGNNTNQVTTQAAS